MDELFRVTLAELEIRQRQAMQLREALLPLLDEIGTGGDLDYHLRTDGHAERLQAALSTPADDWLVQHDAEVRAQERERCQWVALEHNAPELIEAARIIASAIGEADDE